MCTSDHVNHSSWGKEKIFDIVNYFSSSKIISIMLIQINATWIMQWNYQLESVETMLYFIQLLFSVNTIIFVSLMQVLRVLVIQLIINDSLSYITAFWYYHWTYWEMSHADRCFKYVKYISYKRRNERTSRLH